jgi:hypothetical protein
MMREELTHRVRAIDFKTVIGAPELREQAQIMKGRRDKQEPHIELLAGLAVHFVGPEERTMRMVEQEGCTERPQQTGLLRASTGCLERRVPHAGTEVKGVVPEAP